MLPSFKPVRHHVRCVARLMLVATMVTFVHAPFATAEKLNDSAQAFVTSHCADCHDDGADEGGFTLASLQNDLSAEEQLQRWVRVHDRIAAGEMPPPDTDQPDANERDQLLSTLSSALETADRDHRQVVLRRLNRQEYQNTIRDLLNIEIDPRKLLPEDQQAEGFDNIGRALSLSTELMQSYIEAAETAIDAAIMHDDKPETQTFAADSFEEVKPYVPKQYTITDGRIVTYMSSGTDYSKISTRDQRTPEAGTYRFRFSVIAHQSDQSLMFSVVTSDFKPVGATVVPLLESMIPLTAMANKADTATPQQMIGINIPLGFYGPNFFPEDTGRDYKLSPYLIMGKELRKEFTVISGVSHPDVDGGHSAEKSFLTAAPHPASRNFRNSVSLDQLIAAQVGDKTRFASLTLGDHSMSWSANGVSIPAEVSPSRLFEKLFLQGNEREMAAQRNHLQDGNSILDTILQDAGDMRRRISTADNEKLEQYFTAIRQTEQRLAKTEAWSKMPKPRVGATQPQDIPGEDITRRLQTHLEIMGLALQTDSTRVITLGGNSGSLVLPLRGVSESYHGLSHHGKNPNMVQQLEIIDRATMQIFFDFLTSLKETREGDSDLLGATQVLFGSNLGNASSHDTKNLPIILSGGGYRHGQHIAFDKQQNHPLPNLFVTMMQQMGIESERFASSTGTVEI